MTLSRTQKSRQNERIIKALYDETTITIYQAFNTQIAKSALIKQTLTSPDFKMDRMTWIKPSFLWMMYRSQWSTNKNQEHILSVKMKRQGFDWALANSCLTSFKSSIHKSHANWKFQLTKYPVRVQWDPERDIHLQPQPTRTIQIGLSGIALEKYVSEWIIEIKDITDYCKYIHSLVDLNLSSAAPIPSELNYPIPHSAINKI